MLKLVLVTVLPLMLALGAAFTISSPEAAYPAPAALVQTVIGRDDPQTYPMLLAAVAMMVLIARRRSRRD